MVDRTEGLSYSIGNAWHDIDAEASRDRLDGYAVVSGLTPTPGSGLEVSIASGEAIVGTDSSGNIQTATLGSSTSVSLDAADSTFPRKDVVHIDSSGTVAVTTGTAEEALPDSDDPGGPATRFDTYQPEPPEYPTDVTVLAEVWVPAGATSLQSADVRDRRQPADVVGGAGVFDSVSTDRVSIRDSGTVDFGLVSAGSTAQVDVSFNTDFSTSPIVVLTPGNSGGAPADATGSVDQVETGGFRAQLINNSGTDSNYSNTGWIALERF